MDHISSFFNNTIMPKVRTAGDGMESANSIVETKPTQLKIQSSNLVQPIVHTRLVQVYPTAIMRSEKKKSLIYSKAPKFVPYEPYPAAVKPIVPQVVKKGHKRVVSKNNMDINTLITQMSQMDTNIHEYKPRAKLTSVCDRGTDDPSKQPEEMLSIKKKLSEMEVENESLKDQLKQQAQVNKELKTMLVASMGEDLETQVQTLNEDKKHLAKALLNSAQHLTTHQEQTEWLAGQCEVWRSKFLASSLMVEELANWKKLLSERTESLEQAIKLMLDERSRVRDMLLYTHKNIYSLHDQWLKKIAAAECVDQSKHYMRPEGSTNISTKPHSTNIIDLASVNLKLSENISSSVEKQDVIDITDLQHATEGELLAENTMSAPAELPRTHEAGVAALVSRAHAAGAAAAVAACHHCNARVQLL